MPRFLIERTVPGAGSLSPSELQALSRKSCETSTAMATAPDWVHSYLLDDRLFCIQIAASADVILEHSARAGFPVDRISEIRAILDPSTAQ